MIAFVVQLVMDSTGESTSVNCTVTVLDSLAQFTDSQVTTFEVLKIPPAEVRFQSILNILHSSF